MAAVRLLFPVAMLLLAGVLLTEGLRMANTPKSCCFEFVKKPISQSRLVSYKITSQQCSNEGVVFQTSMGRNVCANPSETWVPKAMKAIDNKNSKKQPKA